MNASTSQDRTDYFQTLPREYLGLGLWLEADRMRSLKVTEENFQNQLSVVKEERKQNYDNRPYGLWYLTILEMLYSGSSYAWGPIGDMSHLDASPLEAVQEFHSAYYRPNNATLVVSGDFETEEAKGLIERMFGSIEAGPEIERPEFVVAPLTEQARRTIQADVPFPSVTIGFQSAHIGHPDSAALSVLSLLLGHGRSSRMQHELVYRKQMAQSVMVFEYDQEKSGLFIIQATAGEGSTADALEREIWSLIEQAATEGFSEREVRRGVNYIETALVRSLSHVSGVASLLARYHVLLGDASRARTLFDEYAAVTPDDLRRVVREYLKPESAAVLHYLPEK
jgi:predicted Zn-dependent peptidase